MYNEIMIHSGSKGDQQNFRKIKFSVLKIRISDPTGINVTIMWQWLDQIVSFCLFPSPHKKPESVPQGFDRS